MARPKSKQNLIQWHLINREIADFTIEKPPILRLDPKVGLPTGGSHLIEGG